MDHDRQTGEVFICDIAIANNFSYGLLSLRNRTET